MVSTQTRVLADSKASTAWLDKDWQRSRVCLWFKRFLFGENWYINEKSPFLRENKILTFYVESGRLIWSLIFVIGDKNLRGSLMEYDKRGKIIGEKLLMWLLVKVKHTRDCCKEIVDVIE